MSARVSEKLLHKIQCMNPEKNSCLFYAVKKDIVYVTCMEGHGVTMDKVKRFLFENKDDKYAEFQRKLVPTVLPEKIIGVRTPVLKAYAKEMLGTGECESFIESLPHDYFEENQLHGFIISGIKDFDECIEKTEEFLPFVDNWATCDQTSPKVFKKQKTKLLKYIKKWIKSGKTYHVRFAIGMLMQHFLDDDFKPEYAELVASIRSDEYYVNMEIAWYLATALAKQWKTVVGILEEKKLNMDVQNKTIRKAVESFRISEEHREYLKTLKM